MTVQLSITNHQAQILSVFLDAEIKSQLNFLMGLDDSGILFSKDSIIQLKQVNELLKAVLGGEK